MALPFFGTGMKTDLFQAYGHCWVFQICWHIECSTLTASSFRILNSSASLALVIKLRFGTVFPADRNGCCKRSLQGLRGRGRAPPHPLSAWDSLCAGFPRLVVEADFSAPSVTKGPDAGKDRRWEEKGITEDEVIGWHHLTQRTWVWANSGRQWWQGSLVCCGPRGCKESDTTYQLNNNNSLPTKRVEGMEFQLSYFKSWKMMLWKCCTQYASKYGKLSNGHRTGKGQFSFQSQRKAIPKNAQTTTKLHSFHMLAK